MLTLIGKNVIIVNTVIASIIVHEEVWIGKSHWYLLAYESGYPDMHL